ncbi:MAG TPA: hydantoinase/oxoprolinase family protein [Burkholderiales bacterium]|nr:hydantoinase/oxoprolinase family protein [Burkholderiales bacterium]
MSKTNSGAARYRIGIDVGGTFTDLFLLDETSGAVARHKLLSTPGEPHRAPLAGIREILATLGGRGADVGFVGLGTTVMTNALLERKGAATGLITTAGFRDLLEIARQIRPHTFDPFVSKPEPLVPRQLRLEVVERIAADGTVITPLERASLERAIEALQQAGVKAIAVCLLNSYANPAHERAIADALRTRWPGAHVSISTDVLPEFREYERLSSTVVNAYLMPVTREYFRAFAAEIAQMGVPEPPFIMNSGGGIMTPEQAGERPIDTLFSGPSGGVSGAIYVAGRGGYANIITFDMGGTSTDVCLIQNGKPQLSHSRIINGVPLKAAALDVHTVGAGGSSIAGLDAGGMLYAGPHSAGARPGPACYGNGGDMPTVTDANVVLGRLNPEFLLGGALKIDAARSRTVIERDIAKPRGVDAVDAAASIIAIADTNMAHAVRFVSVERGLDPGDFMLVAFGGAGPVHAAAVARHLGVAGVLVPPAPGVLCAMGVLVNDLQADFSRTRMTTESAPDCIAVVDGVYRELEARGRTAFSGEKIDASKLDLARMVDARYAGQNHELTVDVPAGPFTAQALVATKANFHAAHREMFGYESPEKPIELVTFRLRARLKVARGNFAGAPAAARKGALKPAVTRKVYFDDPAGFVACPVYDRDTLMPGDAFRGPAIVEQMDCTTVVPPDFGVRVDDAGNLLLKLSS